MSHRQLRLMTPEAISKIIEPHDIAVAQAVSAQADLEERKEFGARVAEELGYKVVKHATEAETIKMPADVVLLKTLQELGVCPLDRESVKDYMDSQVKNRRNVLVKFIGLLGIWAGATFTVALLIAAFATPEVAVYNVYGLGWLGPTLLAIGCVCFWAEYKILPRFAWDSYDLEHVFSFTYGRDQQHIPREALEVALRIKEKLPKVDFRVHLLEKQYDWRSSFGDDPFLEAWFGGESYFIAVWDELGFDGKLMQIP